MGTPSPSGSWEHIITQIGMFAYTGLTAEHVASLLSELSATSTSSTETSPSPDTSSQSWTRYGDRTTTVDVALGGER